jgi:ubiquinone/menaquinone biosynthesis C-methylase UbiE
MGTTEIRFDDGEAYERFMGVWSAKVGNLFIDWLKPRPRLRWIDVGCGNGAFTELLVARCSPAQITGVDPSDAQLEFARERHTAGKARFIKGDAMSLPVADNSVDAATMGLVIFFVPDPQRGVSEMARVVAPGGSVSAYAWDMPGGGFPAQPMHEELDRLGITAPSPPHPEASAIAALEALWAKAGLTDIETTIFTVERSFESFEDLWETTLAGPRVSAAIRDMPPDLIATYKANVKARFTPDYQGRITCRARANAIKGTQPG